MDTNYDTHTPDMEAENDYEIYQSLIDRGCTKQEIDRVFHILWFYGSVHLPDEPEEHYPNLYELVCEQSQIGCTA